MTEEKEVKVSARMFFTLVLVCFFTPLTSFSQESVTIRTYYPTPVGVYNQVTAAALASQVLSVGDTNGDGNIDGTDAPEAATESGQAWIMSMTGIGTNAPGALLHVSENGADINRDLAIFESGSAAGDVRLLIKQEAGYSGIELQTQQGDSTRAELVLNPGGGFIGIGTSSPQTALDVNGDMVIDGTLRIKGMQNACDPNQKGVIVYDADKLVFRGCDGAFWRDF